MQNEKPPKTDEIEQDEPQEFDDFREDIDSKTLAEALATIKNNLND